MIIIHFISPFLLETIISFRDAFRSPIKCMLKINIKNSNKTINVLKRADENEVITIRSKFKLLNMFAAQTSHNT